MRVDVEWGDAHPDHQHLYVTYSGWRWQRWWFRRQVWEQCWYCDKIRRKYEKVDQ